MALIKQFDKRSGLTYVYESKSYWDKEKKQPRSKRTLVGRLDPLTGDIVPTDGRGKRRGQSASNSLSETNSNSRLNPLTEDIVDTDGRDKRRDQSISNSLSETNSKKGSSSLNDMSRLFCGATYLFDQIGEITGLTSDLKACFPYTYKQIQSLAYYLILEEGSPLFRFSKWQRLHMHPFAKNISSQRSSELFQSITEEDKFKFFRLQAKRRAENEYWAYDSTSISSYSEQLKQVKRGKNKDGDNLAQLNLLLLFGEQSKMPFYYRKIAGNIPDVKTVNELLKELDVFDIKKIKLVMDRGFYSSENINALYKEHYKFLISAKTSLSLVKSYIKEIASQKDDYANYNSNYQLYSFSKTISWDYTQKRPYKGDTISDERRMYLHLFYNSEKYTSDVMALNNRLDRLKEELLSNKRVAAHEKDYAKYFNLHETPKRGLIVSPNQKAINEAKERYGFFALLSNEIKDPITALKIYRTRDVVEKAFGNMKDRLNLKRTLVSSDLALEGKLFVEFIALIYLSYIKMKMEENNLFKTYTMSELLDELDVIECFVQPNKEPILGEVTKKQEQIFIDLGIKPLVGK